MPTGSPSQAAIQPSAEAQRARALALRGESQLATIVAIRRLARAGEVERAELLNDLAVLRHAAGDRRGALACARASLEIEPGLAGARANLAALEALGDVPVTSVDHQRPTGATTLNPWVIEGLEEADRAIGLAGKRVLEVGGNLPAEAARALGVAHWTACDLDRGQEDAVDYTTVQGDAAALAIDSASHDAAWSVCAFEHFARPAEVLREVHRVLRPGGRFFAQFAPIWSCAHGHHTWVIEKGESSLTFNDRVVPAWSHLLLDECELLGYLTVVVGTRLARLASAFHSRSKYINRVSEGDFQRLLAESPFAIERCEPWGGRVPPQPALREELLARHPGLGDPAVVGLRWVLRA